MTRSYKISIYVSANQSIAVCIGRVDGASSDPLLGLCVVSTQLSRASLDCLLLGYCSAHAKTYTSSLLSDDH